MAVAVLGVVRETILAPKLAELARPVRQGRGGALVGQTVEAAAIGIIEPATSKPATPELVVCRGIEPESALLHRKLLALAPNELASSDKRMVDGPPQRLPAQSRVSAVELGDKITSGPVQRHCIVVPTRVREPEIQVRRFRQVLITS